MIFLRNAKFFSIFEYNAVFQQRNLIRLLGKRRGTYGICGFIFAIYRAGQRTLRLFYLR